MTRPYAFIGRPQHIRTLDGKYCRVDGGTISPSRCPRCADDHERAYEVALLKLDRQANRGR